MKNTSMRQCAGLVVAGLAVLLVADIVDPARAGRNRDATPIEVVQSRPAGTPVMAIVSLSDQRVTIYDDTGWIMRAPVSSGRTGYETPAGIYSVIQKEAEHYSNLYDDGFMPFMQRITWSGIALHGGPLPGYPASHGCVRMPYEFAERLFDLTRIGMRVIVARNDVAPTEITHPVLFKPKPVRSDVGLATQTTRRQESGKETDAKTSGAAPPGSGAPPPAKKPLETWQSIAAAKAAEADAAVRKADALRLIADKKTWEAARAATALRVAEFAKSRAETQLSAAESALEKADLPAAIRLAEETRTKALAKVADAQARLTAAMVEAQPRPDVARAREEAEAAEAEKVIVLAAAREAARKASPVSVFISRKTQRLYVRQASQPVFENSVAIRDADHPIGTHIFTVLNFANGGSDVRWSAVSMYENVERYRSDSNDRRRRRDHLDAEPMPKDAIAARAALDRIVIPQEAIEQISELVSPGSSLIISDEGISTETENGTDFVILMSGEPQGGIKMRRHHPEAQFQYNRLYNYNRFWR